MTIKNLVDSGAFSAVSVPFPEREINGVYIGDLLSWVIGRANDGNVWITIMSNVNVVAVASLVDVSCVILAENTELDADALEAAQIKGINVLSSELPIYETALSLSGMI